MAGVNEGEVIGEFLGGAPRASEWRALRDALKDRLAGLKRERGAESDPARLLPLDKEIAALARQIGTLETEEVVTRFVEDSIKASLARAPEDAGAEEE